MTKREIEKLGFAAGESAVDAHERDLRRYVDEETDEETEVEIRRRLEWTLTPGQLSWDTEARNVHAHTFDKIFGSKNVERYYAAYCRGAAARIAQLVG